MLHKTLLISNSSPMPRLRPHSFRLVAIVSLLVTLSLLAGGVAAAPAPGLSLVSTNPAGLVLELNVPDFELQPATAGRQRVVVPGLDMGETGAPGQPRLPAKSVLVAIPPAATVHLRLLIDDVNPMRVGVRPDLVPVEQPQLQQPYQDDPASILDLANPLDAYLGTQQVASPESAGQTLGDLASQSPYQPVALAETGYFRDQRFVRLIFRPFDLQDNGLRLHRRLRVALSFDTPPAIQTPAASRPDPYFESVLQRTLVNYEQGRGWRLPATEAVAAVAPALNTTQRLASSRTRMEWSP